MPRHLIITKIKKVAVSTKLIKTGSESDSPKRKTLPLKVIMIRTNLDKWNFSKHLKEKIVKGNKKKEKK